MKNIIIFTGAGISKDSGISTFRESDGLWENHKIEDVATPKGFKKDPQLVWDFYKSRHDELINIKPNAAHIAITKFQEDMKDSEYSIHVVTQNVDRLHTEAKNQNVIELHGNLYDVKCSSCDFIDHSQEYWKHIEIPKCPKCNENLRPNIVWFNEELSVSNISPALKLANGCSHMIIVGTSCKVYPAFSIVEKCQKTFNKIYECNIKQELKGSSHYTFLEGSSSETLPKLLDSLTLELIQLKQSTYSL